MSNGEIVRMPTVDGWDGFGDVGGSDRMLQGSIVRCVDGEWTYAKDDTPVPKDKRFLVLGTAEGQQHWQDGQLVEERVKKPNAPFAETVDELNAKIPQKEWEEGMNGPRPQWSHVFAVYLLDPTDGAIYTSINNTSGQAAATRELKEKVKWMRAMRGEAVHPIVTLGRRLHSKKWKKIGPSFDVVPGEWRNLGALPTTQSPALPAPLGTKVEEPTLSEQMGDEVPWNDSPDIPKTTSPKPAINKKGVQKIA